MAVTPRWEVPVLDNNMDPVDLVIMTLGPNVLMIPPTVAAWYVPPSSDYLLCESLRQAREAADGSGS